MANGDKYCEYSDTIGRAAERPCESDRDNLIISCRRQDSSEWSSDPVTTNLQQPSLLRKILKVLVLVLV